MNRKSVEVCIQMVIVVVWELFELSLEMHRVDCDGPRAIPAPCGNILPPCALGCTSFCTARGFDLCWF